MTLKSLVCSRALLISFSVVAGSHSHLPAQTRTPDATAPDSAGPYRLRAHMPPREQAKTISKMQEFAWPHWKNRRRGTLFEHYGTVEGAPIEIYLIFENDEKGAWRVRIERKELRSFSGNKQHVVITRRTQLAYIVQRVDERKPTDDDYEALSDSLNLRPGTYIMEFRDKEGQLLLTLDPFNTMV